MANKTQAAPKSNAKSILIKIGVIAFIVVFVAVLAFSALRYTTGVVHRAATAVTVGSDKLTAMDMRIFHTDTRSNYLYQYGYILEMYGYDMSTIDSQVCLLDNTVTWGEYFVNQGLTQATNVLTLNRLAKDAGFEMTDEIEENIARYMDSLEETAEAQGMSVKKYIKKAYGRGTTVKDIEKVATMSQYANAYYDYLFDGYFDSYTADEVQAYYEDNKNDYDVHEYYSLTVPFTKYTYKAPAEGESVPAGQPTSTEEANRMTQDSREDAQNLANSIMAEVTADNFDTVAKKYWADLYPDDEFDTALTTAPASDITSLIGKWCSTEGTVKGSKDVLEDYDNGKFTVVLYVQRYRSEIDTVDVRHILINTQTAASDATDAEKAEIEAANAEAKAEAERIYAEWKAGEATEESFAKLAKQYSQDSGSVAKGGLYETVAPGDMIAEYDEWCFDENRKPGDNEIVKTDYGYHIMYFVGEGMVQYEAFIREALAGEEYSEFYAAKTADMPVSTSDFGVMLMFS